MLAVCLLLGQVGAARLPDWVLDASPFPHPGNAPVHTPQAVPLVVLLAVAVALAATARPACAGATSADRGAR